MVIKETRERTDEQKCATLNVVYPDSVAYPNTSQYNLEEAGYWSAQQEETDPFCFFEPPSNTAVAVALLLSRLTQCPFAVKSGGHAAFSGASNIEGGITINFAKLNEVTLSSNKSLAYVGPGNTWYDVYTQLQPEGVQVIGGRVAAIGVGGLTLGGGVSFFSGEYGWACDNVYNYQVVTANGEIIDVNYDSEYSDLYWALRGGGNNFGLVTRFDLYTFPQGLMWGGALTYYGNYTNDILKALLYYGENAPSDPKAAVIVAVAYAEGQFVVVADLEYTVPTYEPAILQDFFTIPHISDTTTNQTLADITLEFNASNPSGFRETYWTATYALNMEMLQYIVEVYENETLTIADVPGLVPACVLQIITTDEVSHMSKNGGNALGLTTDETPLLLLNLAFWWEDESDDYRVLVANQNIVDKTVAYAQSNGWYNEYLYMNYASQFQDVVPSYGSANHARLVQIAQKYDPTGVFQTLQPGYFKLNGAPGGTTIPTDI
ncbi:hypothetical protein M433DRAFT_61160 [Acidomyces richmondensis BFW]|nr:MAG: hypothetical protein FE78DRAFT_224360 [Acidomyces sp. 'richmondensis']KYG48417.1 hypothetical protein M433DRAFT_61160 [Acidomyces richmondensis BFW]